MRMEATKESRETGKQEQLLLALIGKRQMDEPQCIFTLNFKSFIKVLSHILSQTCKVTRTSITNISTHKEFKSSEQLCNYF